MPKNHSHLSDLRNRFYNIDPDRAARAVLDLRAGGVIDHEEARYLLGVDPEHTQRGTPGENTFSAAVPASKADPSYPLLACGELLVWPAGSMSFDKDGSLFRGDNVAHRLAVTHAEFEHLSKFVRNAVDRGATLTGEFIWDMARGLFGSARVPFWDPQRGKNESQS